MSVVASYAPLEASSRLCGHPKQQRAGAFIEHPQLTQLSAMLKVIDTGDRIIKGRLELFSCVRRRLSQHQQRDLERRDPGSLSGSPLGPLTSDSAQVLLANLRVLMSLLFVSYDSSRLNPSDFEHCPDKHIVVATVNRSLADVVDRLHNGFLAEFWQAVQDAIDIVGCEVYAFKPTAGTFGPTDNSLMSFHYFFIDFQRGHILFIGSITKTRASVRGGMDSDSDVGLSGESMSSVSSQDCRSSDMSENLHDGEIAALSNDDIDDERMFD